MSTWTATSAPELTETYAGVNAGDGDERSRRPISAIDYIQLSASEVELGSADARSDVKGNLAGRDVGETVPWN